MGHVVGSGKVQPEALKVQAVEKFSTPQTKKDVRTFLGLMGYYRRFIPGYSAIATPLTDLTKKTALNHVIWTPSCNEAFHALKRALCSSLVLRSPKLSAPFILQTDASNRGIGAVLSQLNDAGEEHPVAFYSRKLLPREEKYSTIEEGVPGD